MSESCSSGPVALVSGASRGIGRAVALALAGDGCRVAVHYHQAAEAAAAVVAEIEAAGGAARPFAADLADPEAPAALVQAVLAQWGGLDILVANAGINASQPLVLTSIDAWRRLMAVNLDAAFLLTKAALRPMLRQRRGRIIYLSSDAALLGDLLHGAYSASKSGLLGLAKTAARETAASGITVNAVAPGPIETDMTAGTSDATRARQLAAIPLGRYGTPREVAAVVRFLASADAAYITGQIIGVDGGLRMRE